MSLDCPNRQRVARRRNRDYRSWRKDAGGEYPYASVYFRNAWSCWAFLGRGQFSRWLAVGTCRRDTFARWCLFAIRIDDDNGKRENHLVSCSFSCAGSALHNKSLAEELRFEAYKEF